MYVIYKNKFDWLDIIFNVAWDGTCNYINDNFPKKKSLSIQHMSHVSFVKTRTPALIHAGA